MTKGDYLISKFFCPEDLKEMKDLISHYEWVDGIETLSVNADSDEEELHKKRKLKRNLQCHPDPEIFYQVLDVHEEYLNWTQANSSTLPTISLMKKGGYYRPHFDGVENGHFSTTIFMNDPSTYEGGELCLWLKGEEKRFKLKAGMGITYETGTGHRVSTVTKGERLACIFWSTSKVNNMKDLYAYRYYDMMSKRYTEKTHKKLEPFMNDLHTHFIGKSNNILRRYI